MPCFSEGVNALVHCFDCLKGCRIRGFNDQLKPHALCIYGVVVDIYVYIACAFAIQLYVLDVMDICYSIRTTSRRNVRDLP